MSDSIPEDICETAYELAFVWAMPDEAALTRCTDAIARAILAEREAERERVELVIRSELQRQENGYRLAKSRTGKDKARASIRVLGVIAAAIRNPERD